MIRNKLRQYDTTVNDNPLIKNKGFRKNLKRDMSCYYLHDKVAAQKLQPATLNLNKAASLGNN